MALGAADVLLRGVCVCVCVCVFSSAHVIFQARILRWVAISYSRDF